MKINYAHWNSRKRRADKLKTALLLLFGLGAAVLIFASNPNPERMQLKPFNGTSAVDIPIYPLSALKAGMSCSENVGSKGLLYCCEKVSGAGIEGCGMYLSGSETGWPKGYDFVPIVNASSLPKKAVCEKIDEKFSLCSKKDKQWILLG